MKTKVIVLLCAVFICPQAYAQQLTSEKVPADVKNSFKAKFPDAADAKWEMEENIYEASFKMKGNKHSASFDKTGKWEETETEMKVDELPMGVAKAIGSQFSGYKIKEAEKVESAKHGKAWEVEITKGKETWEVVMNDKGEVLKKKAEKEEKDEDD